MIRSFFVWLALACAVCFAQEPPSVVLDPLPEFTREDSVTLSGTVTPADSVVTLGSLAVTVNPDGTFSHPLTLNDGFNSFFLAATHGDDPPFQRGLTLTRDTQPPTLTLTGVSDRARVNRTPYTLVGRVADDHDDRLSLTRDGNPVVLENGAFRDPDLALQPGDNRFTYLVTDRAGNSAEQSITLSFNDQPPQPAITAPDHLAAGDNFTFAVSFAQPEHIAAYRVILNQTTLHQAEDGAPFQIQQVADGNETLLRFSVQAEDLWGNNASTEHLVHIAFPAFGYGTLLDDRDSRPLAGVALRVSTPLQSQDLVSGPDGDYQFALSGSPVTLEIRDPTYVQARRRLDTPAGGGRRFADWRLTPRGPPQSTAVPFQNDQLDLRFSGFTGTPRVSPFTAQAQPVPLPLDWTPLAGFELADVGGTGRIEAVFRRLPYTVPGGATLVLFRAESDGWRVLSLLNGTLAATVDTRAGAFLLAAPAGATNLPAVGDLIQHTRDHHLGLSQLSTLTIDPPVVSLLKQPQTEVTVTAAPTAPSGSWARVHVRERHQHTAGPIDLPEHTLDLLLFRHPFDPAASMRGSLEVHTRMAIDRTQTRNAHVLFTGIAYPPPDEGYRFQNEVRLETLSLTFPNAGSQPVNAFADTPTDLPLMNGADLIMGFQWNAAATVPAPRLRLRQPARAAMILLRRDTPGTWLFVGALQHDGTAWYNNDGACELDQNGWYALVALDFAVGRFSGRTLMGGNPLAAVALRTPSHPWRALSDADGAYHFFLPLWDQTQSVHAQQATTGFHAERTFAAVTAANQTGVDFNLNRANLLLVDHQPTAEAVAVPPWRFIDLDFSQPLVWDPDLLAQHIRLSGPEGVIPLRFTRRFSTSSVRIRARQALAQATTYTLSLDPALQAESGDVLGSATQFRFTTHTRASETPLNLNPWYLAEDNGNLVLHAPADTFPAGSQLVVLNLDTASSSSETLAAGALARVVSGDPGDRIRVDLTTPGGQFGARVLDSVRRDGNRILLGSQPFQIPVGDGLTLVVENILTGIGRELTWQQLSTAEYTRLQGQLPQSQRAEGPSLGGFILQSGDGQPLPRFQGRLVADMRAHATLLDAAPDQTLVLRNIREGVRAPADPRQPDVLSDHTIAQFQGASPVSAAAAGKTAAKRSLNTLYNFDFFSLDNPLVAIWNIALYPPTTYVANIYSLREEAPPVQMPESQLMWAEAAEWQESKYQLGDKNYRAIRHTPLYEVVNTGENTALEFVGLTDRTGWTQIFSNHGSQPSYFAMDPVSSALGSATPQSTGIAIGGLLTLRYAALLNWPAAGDGQTPNQDVQVEFEVVDLKYSGETPEPAVTVNSNETARLTKLGRVKLAENRAIRVTLTAANNPFTRVSFDADYQDTVTLTPESSGFQIQYRYENLPRDRAYSDLTLRFTSAAYPERQLERRVWFIGETGDIADDPANPPTVTGTLPADNDRDVPIFDPIQIAFSEPVRGVSEANIELVDQDQTPVPLDFEDLAGEPIGSTDWVHKVYARPQTILKLDHQYRLRIRGLRDQGGNALLILTPDGETDTYQARFQTQPIKPDPIQQSERSQRGYTQYRNLLIQVSHREAVQDQPGGLTIEVIDPGDADRPWLVKARHELVTPAPFFPKPALVTQQALLTPVGDEVNAVEGPSRKPVTQLPGGSVLAITYWDGNQAINRMFLLRWTGRDFTPVGHFPVASPGIINDVIAQGPFLVFGHNAFESQGSQIGRIEVRDLRTYLAKLEEIRERELRQSLSPHQYLTAFTDAGMSAQFFYPRGIFDLEPLVHTDTEEQILSFTAAAATFPGVGKILAGDNSFLPPVDTWYDQRLLFRAHYPEEAGREIPADAPARPGGSRLRTAVLPQLGVRDRGLRKVRDLTLFVENFGDGTDSGTSVLHFIEVPEDKAGKAATAPVLPRVTLAFNGRIGNMAADRHTGLIAVALDKDLESGEKGPLNVVLIDARAVYAGLQSEEPVRLAVNHQSPFITAEFGGELGNALGDALFFHEGFLYWTNGKVDLIRQPVNTGLRRELGWLSYDMTVWHSDPKQRRQVPELWQRQTTVVLHAADLAAAEQDPGQGVSDAVKRMFTTEIGTFQVQLFPDEHLELTMRCLDPEWEKTFEVEPTQQRRMISVNTAELATWLESRQETLKTRGMLGYEVALNIRHNGITRLGEHYPFIVRYINPPNNDPYRYAGNLDLLSRTPTEFAVDDAVRAVDSRIDLSTMRYHHGDFHGSLGTFGVGMRDSGALHLGSAVWFRPKDLPAQITGERLKADQRILLGQPGLWRVEADLKQAGKAVVFRDDPLSKLSYHDKKWVLEHRETMTSTWYSSLPLPAYHPLFDSLNSAEADSDTDIDKKDRIIYPLMRYQAASNTPGALFGRVIERERKDFPWQNKFQRGDLDEAVTDLPTELTDQPADGAAKRKVERSYRPHLFGNLLEEVKRGTRTVRYSYDADAYLIAVSEQGSDSQSRVTRYRWEDTEVKAGDVPIKRLIAIERDNGDNPFLVAAWTYAHAQGFTVAGYRDPFCSEETPYTFELTGGETSSFTVPACDGLTAPWTVTFDTATERRLSKSWRRGAAGGSITWQRRPFQEAYDWRIVADSFRAQTFDYNSYGFPTQTSIDGLVTSRAYQTTKGFRDLLASQSVNPGQGQEAVDLTVAIEDSGKQHIITDTDSGHKLTRFYADSGVFLGSSDVTGIHDGPTGSQGYYPRGGSVAKFDAVTLANKLAPGKDTVRKTTFNQWGQPVSQEGLGATTTLTYDPIGRLTQTETKHGATAITRTLTTTYENGRCLVTAVDSEDDSTSVFHYDQRGLLREVTITGGPAPGVTRYSYDDHGRLTEVVDAADKDYKTTLAYHGDTEVVTSRATPTATFTYTVTPGTGVLVDGLTITPSEGQPETIPLKIDALGRTAVTRLAGIGAVRHRTDAFGNPLSVAKETSGAAASTKNQEALFSWEYAQGKVAFTDHWNARALESNAVGNTWLDSKLTEQLNQLPFEVTINKRSEGRPNIVPETTKTINTTITTTIKDNRLVRIVKNETSGIQREIEIDGLGQVASIKSGNRSLTGSLPDQGHGRYARWTGADGRTLDLTYNDATQLTGAARADLGWTALYDTRGRVSQTTSSRDLTLSYQYQGISGLLDRVATQQANRAAGPLLETSGEALSTARQTHRSWLGDEVLVQQEIDRLGETTVTRGEHKATVNHDSDTYLLKDITTFSGETNEVTWEHHNKVVKVKAPDGTTAASAFDQHGNLYGAGVIDTEGKEVNTLQVFRDAEQRVKYLVTPRDTLEYIYDGWNLTGVRGENGAEVAYSYDTGHSRPKTITLKQGGQLEQEIAVSYHANGNPSCVTVEAPGRLPESYHYNAFGDLIRHQRPHQASSTVSFNAWGAPKTVTTAAGTFNLFEEGASNILTFPNNVTIEINARGLQESISYPGLAAKRFSYDADGRLTGVFEGGSHQALATTWENGRITQITSTAPGGNVPVAKRDAVASETITPTYDSHGRLVRLTRESASAGASTLVETYAYLPDTNDLGRIDRYTDANGVTHQFNYDKKKRFHGTTIGDAVNLHYEYDDTDNVVSVIGPTMFVQYADWQNGYPATITWGDGTEFTINQDGSNRLSSIQTADGSFALQLSYDGNAQIDGCNSAADYVGAKIAGVTRAGPELREILTPSYNPNHTLAGVAVERHIGERPPPATGGEEAPAPEPTYETIRFDESYGSGDKQLLQNLTLILRDQPLADPSETGDIQLRRRVATHQEGPRINSQTEWDAQVVGQTHADNIGQTKTMAYIPENGNLDQITGGEGDQQSFAWDGERRLRALRQGNQLFTYEYDSQGRRIRATTANRLEPMIFAYHGSKVVAIGIKRQGGVDWTHAVGHGPMGPAFIEDLKDREKSYYLFNDHLGTPFAYKRLSDGKVFYTPCSPHGEDWWGNFKAKDLMPGTNPQTQTTTDYNLGSGYERPTFSIFTKPFLGLSGHQRDTETGLIYMHHRYYDPRLGHFLNPDFRAPDIYDPTTFTEPYAYAAGNPMMFWDPSGLKINIAGIKDKAKALALLAAISELIGVTLDTSSVHQFFSKTSSNVHESKADNTLWVNEKGDINVNIGTEYRKTNNSPTFLAWFLNIINKDKEHRVIDSSDLVGFERRSGSATIPIKSRSYEKIFLNFDLIKFQTENFVVVPKGQIDDISAFPTEEFLKASKKSFGLGLIFFHELGHQYLGISDHVNIYAIEGPFGPITREYYIDDVGFVVMLVNFARLELDLPTRESYEPIKVSETEYYLPFKDRSTNLEFWLKVIFPKGG
ncbi:RHS repeat-associated core domain-containing protein [Acanthopleuribacter pedis]